MFEFQANQCALCPIMFLKQFFFPFNEKKLETKKLKKFKFLKKKSMWVVPDNVFEAIFFPFNEKYF
jgi:hypothetical protein